MANDLILWAIIIFAGLFGLVVVYKVMRIILIFVSPDTDNKITLYFILRDVKIYFNFMLKKGYTVANLKYVPHHYAGWHFQLDSPDQELSIVLDHQERPLLVFGKNKTVKRYQIYLEALIYHLTKGNVFIGNSYYGNVSSRSKNFKRTAKLVKAYISQIESYQQNNFERTKNELGQFQEKYIELLLQESGQWLGTTQ